jgi:hypothetical protein
MLRLVTSFKKMTSEEGRGNPSPMHQEALFTQEVIAWLFCTDMFPVLVTGNIVVTNMQVEEWTC